MAAEKLKCKECGERVPARGALRLRALLRSARGRLRPSCARRRRRGAAAADPGGERRTSGATPTSCRSRAGRLGPATALASSPGLPAGWTPLIARRPARRASRAARGVGQERRRQPDPLVQGPRRRRRLAPVRASSASTRSPARRPGTSATPSPRRLPRSDCRPTSSSRPTSRSRRSSATGVYGTNLVAVRGNYDDVNRLCTELSAEHDDWAFVNINMRPYYSEGSKTVAFEIVEQLGWELPDRCIVPIASGSLFTKVHRGFEEWIELGLVERQAAGDERRPGGGLRAGRERVRRGRRTSASRSSRDTIAKSLAIGNPADGPYVLDLARAHRRRRRRRRATSRSARASGCSRRRPASSPRRPAA